MSNEILKKASDAYAALAAFRSNRERLLAYTFGRQWIELMRDSDGKIISEAQFFDRCGRKPVTVNLLRRLIRTLLGNFRSRCDGIYSELPPEIVDGNNLREIDARLFEEFIISGCAIQKVSHARRRSGGGPLVENINPSRFFVNQIYDPRGSDIDLIGSINDYSMARFIKYFSSGTKKHVRALEGIFMANAGNRSALESDISYLAADKFLSSDDKISVVEIWSLEPLGNTENPGPDYPVAWHEKHFAPDGTVVLDRFHSPEVSHPYSVKFYPLIGGEIHSFIEDLVDNQRTINRLLTSFEESMSVAAKGVLLFPQDQLLTTMSFEDVGKLWAQPDSVIPLSGRGSEQPKQVITNVNSSGIVPVLEMQLRLLDEVSGINDVLKGSRLGSTVGAETYKRIIDNADAGITDLIKSFESLIRDRNGKLLA